MVGRTDLRLLIVRRTDFRLFMVTWKDLHEVVHVKVD